MSKKDDKLNKGAEKFSGFKNPRDQHYHITMKGQTLTDTPMHYNDIVKQHGPISKLESKGFRLVQSDPSNVHTDDTGVTNLKSEDSLNKEQMSGSQRFAHAFMPGRRMGMRSIMRRPQGGIVKKDQMSAAAGGQGGDGKPKKPQYFGKPSKEKKQGDKQTKIPSGRDQSHLPKDMKPKKPKTDKMKKEGLDMGKLSAGHKALMGKLKAPAAGGFKSNVGGAQSTPRNFSGGSGQMKATHGGKAATGNQPTSVTRTPTGFKGQSQSGQNVQGSGNGQWTTKQEYKGVGDKIQQTKIPETGSERVMVPIVAEKTKEVVKSDLMEKFSPRFQKGGDLEKQAIAGQTGMPKLDPKGVQGMKDAFKGPDIGGALSAAGSWIKDKIGGQNAAESFTGAIKRRQNIGKSSDVIKSDLMEKFSPQFQPAKPTRKPVDMSGVPSPSKPQGRSDKAPAPSQFGNSGFKPRSNSVEKGDVVDFAAAKKKKEDQEQTQQRTQQASAPPKPTRNMMYPGSDGDKIQQALKTHGSLQGNKPKKPAHKEYFGNKLESIKRTTGQDVPSKGSTDVIKSDLMKEFQPQFQKAGALSNTPKAPTPPANTNIPPTDAAPKGPKLDPKKVKGFMESFSGGRKKTGQMGVRG